MLGGFSARCPIGVLGLVLGAHEVQGLTGRFFFQYRAGSGQLKVLKYLGILKISHFRVHYLISGIFGCVRYFDYTQYSGLPQMSVIPKFSSNNSGYPIPDDFQN